jgi:hypothetical protein
MPDCLPTGHTVAGGVAEPHHAGVFGCCASLQWYSYAAC